MLRRFMETTIIEYNRVAAGQSPMDGRAGQDSGSEPLEEPQ